MNGFLYILGGKAAVGSRSAEKDQIEAHNTVTLTKACAHPSRGMHFEVQYAKHSSSRVWKRKSTLFVAAAATEASEVLRM